MSNVGTTSGKEPDHVEDGDLRTVEELRGDMKAIKDARLSLREKGTVAGLAAEVQVFKQQLEMTHEQIRRLIGMYQTLQSEFDQFKIQRVTELQGRGTGSTSPEDANGTDT
jgi:hypothetical protein